MALIRNTQAGAVVRDAIVLDLGDLRKQGDAMRERAASEADRLLAEARAEARLLADGAAEKGHAEGLERGRLEGFADGKAKGREAGLLEQGEALAALQTAWTNALTEFTDARESMLVEARTDVLRFALEIAQRVVFRIVQIDPTVIEDQMAEALRLLARRTTAVIRVNARDLDLAREVLPRVVESLGDGSDATIVADESVSPGGCIVSGGGGSVDATIEVQIDRIVAALLPGTADDVENENISASRTSARILQTGALNQSSASPSTPQAGAEATDEAAPPQTPEEPAAGSP